MCGVGDESAGGGCVDAAEDVEEDLIPEVLAYAWEVGYHWDIVSIERSLRSDSCL